MIYNLDAALTRKKRGSFLTIDTVEGKAEVTGIVRNFLEYPYAAITSPQKGVTYTDNGDGTVTLTGSNTSNSNAIFTLKYVWLKAGTYNVTGCPSGAGSSKFRMRVATVESSGDTTTLHYITNNYVFTLTERTRIAIQIYVYPGYAITDSLLFKPMITNNLDATYDDYVPYAGYEINSCGKNIFGGGAFKDAMVACESTNLTVDETNKAITFEQNTNYAAQDKRTLFDKFKENTQYTIILYGHSIDTSTATNLSIRYTDDTYSWIKFSDTDTTDNYSVIVSESGKTIQSIRYGYSAAKSSVLYYEKCGIFEGVLTEVDFEPYVSSTHIITKDTEKAYLQTYGGVTNIFNEYNAPMTVRYGTTENGADILSGAYANKKIESLCTVDVKNTGEIIVDAEEEIRIPRYDEVMLKTCNVVDGNLFINNTCVFSNVTITASFVDGQAIITFADTSLKPSEFGEVKNVLINGNETGEMFAVSILDAAPDNIMLSIKCITNTAFNGEAKMSLLMFGKKA